MIIKIIMPIFCIFPKVIEVIYVSTKYDLFEHGNQLYFMYNDEQQNRGSWQQPLFIIRDCVLRCPEQYSLMSKQCQYKILLSSKEPAANSKDSEFPHTTLHTNKSASLHVTDILKTL